MRYLWESGRGQLNAQVRAAFGVCWRTAALGSPPPASIRRYISLALLSGTCLLGGCGRHAVTPIIRAQPVLGNADVDARVFLIGDAGKPSRPEPVLQALYRAVHASPARTAVVFLGDNAYENGVPKSGLPRRTAEAALIAQLDATRIDAWCRAALKPDRPASCDTTALFLPGNHDWRQGIDGIDRQREFIEARSDSHAVFLPADGCPGPARIDLGRWLRLVVLDTDWWLRSSKARNPSGRPLPPCATMSEGRVLDSLRNVLSSAGQRSAIVVAHHALASGGEHGGHFGWQDHIFPARNLLKWLWLPLPGIGTLYTVARGKWGIARDDISGGRYRRMRESLETAFNAAPPLVYAAGHDHNLQVLRGPGSRYAVVSGAGSRTKVTRVAHTKDTYFAIAQTGYMRLDALNDGQIRLGVFVVDERAQDREIFSMWLK